MAKAQKATQQAATDTKFYLHIKDLSTMDLTRVQVRTENDRDVTLGKIEELNSALRDEKQNLARLNDEGRVIHHTLRSRR